MIYTQDQIDDVLENGGVFVNDGVKIHVWKDGVKNEGVIPRGYHIVNAYGNRVYFKCRSRKDAVAACSNLYGKGFYTIREKE